MPLLITKFPQPENVAYLQGEGNYTHIYLTNGQKLFYSVTLLKMVNEHYPSFFRVHKTYAVNPVMIKEPSTDENPNVVIRVGQLTKALPVARRRQKGLEDLLSL